MQTGIGGLGVWEVDCFDVPRASSLGRSSGRTLGHGSGGGAEGSSVREGDAGLLCDGCSEHCEEKEQEVKLKVGGVGCFFVIVRGR